MSDDSGGGQQPIVIKKINKAAGHHGGAWKVAYADFVTAMMAFFLLMWLLNVTDAEQKNAISNYFDPTHPKISESMSGAGGVMGGTSLSQEGAMVTNVQPITEKSPTGTSGSSSQSAEASTERKGQEAPQNITPALIQDNAEELAAQEIKAAEDTELGAVEEILNDAMEKNPELAELQENLMIDVTHEGLRIQVVDSEGKPMFPSGSSQMYERTRQLLTQIGDVINTVPNEISIRGHTDSIPYGAGADYTNWELSSDRANASRRVLQDSGTKTDRLNNVTGKADTEHLLPEDPTNARNRRITIVLLREELSNPEKYKQRVKELAAQKRAKLLGDPPKINQETVKPIDPYAVPPIPEPAAKPFERSEGNVQFP